MNAQTEIDSAPGKFEDRSGRAAFLGLLACALLVFGFGGWALTARLSGAVVTQGKVVVSSDLKAVQHPDGGIVADIRVRNGDRVQAGGGAALGRFWGTVAKLAVGIGILGLLVAAPFA